MDFAVDKIMQPGVFEPPPNLTRENWAKAFEIAKVHADVFNTEPGQALLRHWLKVMFVAPIVRPHEDARADGIREGHADFVRQIFQQLEVARIGPGGPNT